MVKSIDGNLIDNLTKRNSRIELIQSIDWNRDGNYDTEIVNDILSTSVDIKG